MLMFVRSKNSFNLTPRISSEIYLARDMMYYISLLLDDSVEVRKNTLDILNNHMTEGDDQSNFISFGGVDNIIPLLNSMDIELSLRAATLLQMLMYEKRFQLIILKKDNCAHSLQQALCRSDNKLQQTILLILMSLENEAKTFFFQEDTLLFLKNFSERAIGMCRVLSIKIISNCCSILKKYQRESFVEKKEFIPYTDFILNISALTALPEDRFATGDSEGMIIIWSLKSMFPDHIFLSQNWVTQMKALPDNMRFSHILVSAHINNTLSFWNLATGSHVRTIEEESSIKDLALLSNGRLVVASDYGYALKIMSRSYKESILDLRGVGLRPISVLGLPDEQLAVVNHYSENVVEIWDTKSRKRVNPLPIQEENIYKLLSLQNGNIATCATGGIIKIWEVASRKYLKTISVGDGERISNLQVLGDNEIIGSTNKSILVWNIVTGLLIKALQVPQQNRLEKFIVISSSMLLVNFMVREQSVLKVMEIYPSSEDMHNEIIAPISKNKFSLFLGKKALDQDYQQSLSDYYSYDRPSFEHRVFKLS